MAKFAHEVAVAFATQSAEGTFDPTLDAITSALADTDGLLLGAAGQGVRDSGLSLGLGRSSTPGAFLGSSFDRPLSTFLKADVPTFTFAFPFVGNRISPGGAPADGDATPVVGIDGILEGAGMVGGAWGSGVGWQYLFAATNPCSALVYYFGNRLELLDCRVALSIEFPPGGVTLATATVSVGSIQDHSLAALPTLDYGEQETVSAPVIETVGNTWGNTRGWSEATLNIGNTITDIGDSNQTGGFVKEQTDRETTFEATLYADDTTDKGYEYGQLIATASGTLDPLFFLVGDAMTTGNPAEGVGIVLPLPELTEATPTALGTKAAHEVVLTARGSGSGNNALQINFQ